MLINKRPKATDDENVVTKPERIADSMNKYFYSIRKELSKDIPCNLDSFLSNQVLALDRSFIFTITNAEHIIKAISNYQSSHGFGLNNISSFLMKKAMLVLAKGLSQMFN